MKKYIQSVFIVATIFVFSSTVQAQSTEKADPQIEQQKPRNDHKTDAVKEAEINIEKAAESIQRSAEKIKIVIEDKADRIAKNSQPAIESFLVASSNLIEKIAIELEKMLNEKPSKKSSQ